MERKKIAPNAKRAPGGREDFGGNFPQRNKNNDHNWVNELVGIEGLRGTHVWVGEGTK